MTKALEELSFFAVKDDSTGQVLIKCRRPTRRPVLVLNSAIDQNQLIDFEESNIGDLREEIAAFFGDGNT